MNSLIKLLNRSTGTVIILLQCLFMIQYLILYYEYLYYSNQLYILSNVGSYVLYYHCFNMYVCMYVFYCIHKKFNY